MLADLLRCWRRTVHCDTTPSTSKRDVELEYEENYTTRGERNLAEFKRKFATKENYLSVPCQRDSMLYGVCAGVGTLILAHAVFARPKYTVLSTTFVFSFTYLIYFVVCHRRYDKQRAEIVDIKERLQRLREGRDINERPVKS